MWHEARAQSPTAERSGITGGLGLGIGSLEIGNEGNSTLNYDLHFGGYINNQWALQVEVWGGVHNDGDFRISNFNRGISALYWMRDRKVWWKAMLGASTLTTSVADTDIAEFAGVAVAGAGGWVFYERGDYHVDTQFRLTVEGFEDARDNALAFAFGIGVSYF